MDLLDFYLTKREENGIGAQRVNSSWPSELNLVELNLVESKWMRWGMLGIWEKGGLGLIPLPLGRLVQRVTWQWDEGGSSAVGGAVVWGRRGAERLCLLSAVDPVSRPGPGGLLGHADPRCGIGHLWSLLTSLESNSLPHSGFFQHTNRAHPPRRGNTWAKEVRF